MVGILHLIAGKSPCPVVGGVVLGTDVAVADGNVKLLLDLASYSRHLVKAIFHVDAVVLGSLVLPEEYRTRVGEGEYFRDADISLFVKPVPHVILSIT